MARVFQALFAMLALVAVAIAPVKAASAAPACANGSAMATMPSMHAGKHKTTPCGVPGKVCLAACAVAATALAVPAVVSTPVLQSLSALVSVTHFASMQESRPSLLDRPPRSIA